MPIQTTFSKIIPLFMLGVKTKPALSMRLKIAELFKYNINLSIAQQNLNNIKNDISEFNVTINDKEILHDLTAMNEKFDIKAKETLLEELQNYRVSFLSSLRTDFTTIEKDYVESYELFLNSFFSSNLGYQQYLDIPLSKFNRQELIYKIQSFNLKSELNPFKKIDYSAYSDQALYLFYISTEPNTPPTSVKEIIKKLSDIDNYCSEHFPEMERSSHDFDNSKKVKVDALIEVTNNAVDSLAEIGSSVSDSGPDSKNPDMVPCKDRDVNLTM